jgi:hypothetical protein
LFPRTKKYAPMTVKATKIAAADREVQPERIEFREGVLGLAGAEDVPGEVNRAGHRHDVGEQARYPDDDWIGISAPACRKWATRHVRRNLGRAHSKGNNNGIRTATQTGTARPRLRLDHGPQRHLPPTA